ncbi:hypothetical protein ACFV0L_18605 [Streptosporangium canum]|uniref:hypothetical protein n=1 Tax=Streptosporangium canum TaxID=324952 RepID=UPI0036A5A8DB
MLWVENFENGIGLPYNDGGTWGYNNTNPHSGTWCFSHIPIADNQSATLTLTVPPGATTIQFWYSVSSEPTHDKLEVLINGVVRLTAHGATPWTQSAVLTLAGATQVVFRYSKDSSASVGSDAAFIDDIVFQVPDLISPRTNNFDGGTNATAVTTVNSGGASGDAFTNVVGSPQYSNAVARSESGLSVVNAVAGSDTHVDWTNASPAEDVFSARLYIHRLGVLPGYKALIALIGPSGVVSKSWIPSTGRVGVWTGAVTSQVLAAAVGVPVGQWTRVEYRYTINAAGNGTVEVWTYLDPESTTHDDYAISATVAWPGGKPRAAEFHLHRDANSYWHLDDVAIGPAKLGPAPSTVLLRPRGPAGSSQAVHRAASW